MCTVVGFVLLRKGGGYLGVEQLGLDPGQQSGNGPRGCAYPTVLGTLESRFVEQAGQHKGHTA